MNESMAKDYVYQDLKRVLLSESDFVSVVLKSFLSSL